MSIIQELNSFKATPPYTKILKTFKRAAIANRMSVTACYISNVLNGTKKPGADLDRKLQKLADEIEIEQANLKTSKELR